MVFYFVAMLFVLGYFWATNVKWKLSYFELLVARSWRHNITKIWQR